MNGRGALVVGVVVAIARSATAQPAEPGPAIGHETVNLQRFDASSRVGIDGSFIARGNGLYRIELHAQYVEPRTLLGGYLQLPYTLLTQTSDPFNGQEGTLQAFGDLKLGALWVVPSTSSVGIIVHGGVAIPIDKDEHGRQLVSIGALLKPHELYATWPDVTSARGGVSLLLHAGHLFARFDGGIDVNVTTSNAMHGHIPGIHVNAAAGIRSTDRLSFALELSTLTIFVDEPFSFLSASGSFDAPAMLASLGPSVRYRRPSLELYAAVLTPLRDRQRYYVEGGITLGMEYAIR